VHGATGTLLIDTGTTLTEAALVKADVADIADGEVSDIVLTHNHFDHILGSSAFEGATVYCAPDVAATIANRSEHLRAEAVRYGADPAEVASAVSALRTPENPVSRADVDLGGVTVAISHPGPGHTRHDLIVVVDAEAPVVFCGDLVEESGDPAFDRDSDLQAWPSTLDRVLDAGGPEAMFVPGHGAVVDSRFVRRQQEWLLDQV